MFSARLRAKTRWIAIAALTICIEAAGQTILTVKGSEIYKNFVGTWVGTCCDFAGSKDPVLPMHLIITVEKNGRSMRWDYTYGVKGQKGFDRVTKFVSLDPSKNEMIFTWKDSEGKDVFKTDGLQRFAQSGFGRFFGWEPFVGKRLFYMGTFNLDPTSFSYKWETTPDGKNFTMTGLVKLTRETGSSPKAN